MRKYLVEDEWNIIEEGFDPDRHRASESIFSIGNGHMGQRANFEEQYSGDMLRGSYIAGIYYPDKTRVGWWKNGYPEYFAKVLNATNWIGIDIDVDGQPLDLYKCEVDDFRRVLNMKEGFLDRSFKATLANGNSIAVNVRRFMSMQRSEVGAIRYSIKALNFYGTLTLKPYVDGDVMNEDANYDEKFWDAVSEEWEGDAGFVTLRTRKSNFVLRTGMVNRIHKNGDLVGEAPERDKKSKFVAETNQVPVSAGDEVTLYKYAVNASSFDHPEEELASHASKVLKETEDAGFDKLEQEQRDFWARKWRNGDIVIEGDVAAQQGIRFNIFQLNQTYIGDDERLNIGPKGFTGEKYGGSTYWDTEAFCLPFFLNTAEAEVPRNLLRYRYKHLPKAIQNAEKLGFSNGAALYPMVTMNGEECHNEWEITFEEVHRNGAIAYAIHNYIRHTGDEQYLAEYGLEVLIAISRFWAQRVNWSEAKQQYVMLGVTGPNEYENNVHNNWYTNRIAAWTMEYTMEALEKVKQMEPGAWRRISEKTQFDVETETGRWKEIIDHLFFPADEKRGVFLQQEGYLDKKQQTVDTLEDEERPLNQTWSWDRILRSCFIKQADVLQGLYFLEDYYDEDTIRRNFEFYEPRTVHESSLSPCVHVVLAAKLGMVQRAYELYLRTARLDLDDYNEEVSEGCHITSMAGTWMAIVEGFAGKRVRDGRLHLSPQIPDQWDAYDFQILFRGNQLNIRVDRDYTTVTCEEGPGMELVLYGDRQQLREGQKLEIGREVSVRN